jgi:hypothetical protein
MIGNWKTVADANLDRILHPPRRRINWTWTPPAAPKRKVRMTDPEIDMALRDAHELPPEADLFDQDPAFAAPGQNPTGRF